MNFVAGLIFTAVNDEYIAYAIFKKILTNLSNGGRDWRRFYIQDMPKLIEMCGQVTRVIKSVALPAAEKFED
jgi:hypothetical protein